MKRILAGLSAAIILVGTGFIAVHHDSPPSQTVQIAASTPVSRLTPEDRPPRASRSRTIVAKPVVRPVAKPVIHRAPVLRKPVVHTHVHRAAARTARTAVLDGSLGERAHAWANTPKARSVSNCESGGNPRAVNPSGKYRGKWQMDSSFWSSYGGLSFASRPDLASEYEQDIVAYRGWLARGWQPWECG